MNCSKCGSALANSEYKGAFACGTLTDRNGWYHQTRFCKEFAEFRKPLDETITQLTCENKSLCDRVKRLEEAGDGIVKLANDYISLMKAFQHSEMMKEALEQVDKWKQAKDSKP